MDPLILRLDIAGQPVDWISSQECALLYCRDLVAWEAGEHSITLRGGNSRLTGQQSKLELNTIIATRAIDRSGHEREKVPALTNARLFQRDKHLCLYCGEKLPRAQLTRDHVTPVSRGGKDTWENVVSACRACNQRKDNRLISEIGMPLLAIPYAPNRAEGLLLANRTILTDQMAYLKLRVGHNRRT
ncbi:MAG: HNH endonuclease [Gammaproteobacteria bacterium]